jgi:hypothetical protein
MKEAVAAYEAEFGSISPDEMAAQQRADERDARVVRGSARGGSRPRGGSKAASPR